MRDERCEMRGGDKTDGNGQAKVLIFNMFFYLSEQCSKPRACRGAESCEHERGYIRGIPLMPDFFAYFLFW